jgi:hypothetical protein
MKIQDLFENIPSRLPEKMDQLPFDLQDDLIFFMRNDNEFYRRHYYPHIVKCKHHLNQGQNLSNRVFEPLVRHAFECYSNKFPIRELPESLSEKMCEEICNKIKSEESKNISKKIY